MWQTVADLRPFPCFGVLINWPQEKTLQNHRGVCRDQKGLKDRCADELIMSVVLFAENELGCGVDSVGAVLY